MLARGRCSALIGCLLVVAAWLSACGSRLIAQTQEISSDGRQLAPGVLHVIPPGHEPIDTVLGPVDLPLVRANPDLAWTPNYAPKSSTLLEQAKEVTFRTDAHCLEFAFKPVRMIDVELPTKAGYRVKRVWYLIYRVRYLGGDLRPQKEDSKFDNPVYDTTLVTAPWVRYFPEFKLQPRGTVELIPDQVIFAAKSAIEKKERVGKPLYDSVEMQKLQIKLWTEAEDNSVWGVATWVDVDPQTDFFSVEAYGLTNAKQLVEKDGEWTYRRKALELFFSRPGDTIDELEDRIRYGIPALTDRSRQAYVLEQYGVEERLDYRWIYR